DPNADPDDRSQWPTMNPSYPLRTPLESMLRMRENIPNEDSWRREAMGVWSISAHSAAIPPDAWAKQARDSSPTDGLVAYALDMPPDRSAVSIGVAIRPEEGPVHIEVAKHQSAAR